MLYAMLKEDMADLGKGVYIISCWYATWER